MLCNSREAQLPHLCNENDDSFLVESEGRFSGMIFRQHLALWPAWRELQTLGTNDQYFAISKMRLA